VVGGKLKKQNPDKHVSAKVSPQSFFVLFGFCFIFVVSCQINVKDVGGILVVESIVLRRFPFEFWALRSLLSPFADFAWLHSAFSCSFFTLHDSTPLTTPSEKKGG